MSSKHPSQIDIANHVFTPTPDEVALARRAVDAVREAEITGAGAASLGAIMIDAATARMFQVTLDRAALIERRAGNLQRLRGPRGASQ